jgi:hypothetical protein
MPADHRERAFEAAIEACLVGRGGYTHGDNCDRDATDSGLAKCLKVIAACNDCRSAVLDIIGRAIGSA